MHADHIGVYHVSFEDLPQLENLDARDEHAIVVCLGQNQWMLSQGSHWIGGPGKETGQAIHVV